MNYNIVNTKVCLHCIRAEERDRIGVCCTLSSDLRRQKKNKTNKKQMSVLQSKAHHFARKCKNNLHHKQRSMPAVCIYVYSCVVFVQICPDIGQIVIHGPYVTRVLRLSRYASFSWRTEAKRTRRTASGGLPSMRRATSTASTPCSCSWSMELTPPQRTSVEREEIHGFHLN